MSKVRYYTEEQMWDKYYKLTKTQKIDILELALCYMSQANWRSEITCKALAMGYDNREGGTNTYFKQE